MEYNPDYRTDKYRNRFWALTSYRRSFCEVESLIMYSSGLLLQSRAINGSTATPNVSTVQLQRAPKTLTTLILTTPYE